MLLSGTTPLHRCYPHARHIIERLRPPPCSVMIIYLLGRGMVIHLRDQGHRTHRRSSVQHYGSIIDWIQITTTYMIWR